ncbi:MAG: methyltransferase domain-containing protein [Chakrabartia sp.]
MAEELVDRLSFMTLDIQNALLIGHGAAQLRPALPPTSTLIRSDLVPGPDVTIVADEDQLVLEPGQMDLVMACGTLDSVDDLPGALLLIRRMLRPGGLFLGALLGAGSLARFRALVRESEAQRGSQSALRFHPQIEVRSAGDLLFRAGFSTPVADQEDIKVRYSSFATLIADIRGSGAGNALKHPQPLPRGLYDSLCATLDQGNWEDNVAPIYMTGWQPMTGEARPEGPVKGSR